MHRDSEHEDRKNINDSFLDMYDLEGGQGGQGGRGDDEVRGGGEGKKGTET